MSEPPPWTPDHDLTVDQVRAALADARPGARIGDVAFLAAGWDSWAFEAQVDGTPWIYRFPKREDRVPYLLKEIRILDVLRPLVSAPVPHARGPSTSPAVPHPFSGYPRLPGTQIQERASDWPNAARVGAEIGAFLTALHAIPPSAYDGIDITAGARGSVAPARVKGLAALDAFATSLPPALVHDIRRALGLDLTEPKERRAVHNDLGDDHILTDDEGRLTGVIDWADFALAQPHADFVGGTMAFGDAFLLPALAAYDGPVDADFAQRVRFTAVSVMVQCLDWGRHVTDPRWTQWNRDRLPLRVGELLAAAARM